MNDQDLFALQREYDGLKTADQRRDVLMQNLLEQLRNISARYTDEIHDHNAVKLANRSIQNNERELREQLKGYQDMVNRGAYIIVLLDGDGMIFNQKYLAEGEAGGREAAAKLSEYLRNYCNSSIQDMPPDFKVIVRIYVNLKGLADTCYKAGLIDSPATLNYFAYGFTGSKILYDVVDVGVGKERADSKIAETLKLNLNNYHCKHIVLGCSHDNGYARILEDESNPANLSRVTLLEGVPFEKELYLLKSKYRAVKFDDLFRDAKISHHHSVAVPKRTGSPLQKQHPAIPAEGNSTAIEPGKGTAPWAAAAAFVPNVLNNGEVSAPKAPSPTPDDRARIPVNRFGQRVDWPLRVKWDKYEVDKVKGMKLCAKEYLLGQCYSKDCDLEHNKDVSANTVEYLKLFTRLRPCISGLSCQSKNCMYGHACAQNKAGSKDCNWKRFGQKCWYDDELHGIDQQVVKTIIIGPK